MTIPGLEKLRAQVRGDEKHQAKNEGVEFDFTQFALNGQSKEMRKQMLADKFILGRLAILGQSTAFYAKPNAGKTLLTLWLLIEAIKSGEINGSDVFYINADDNHKGLVHKLELAEQYGFNMVAPGYNDFKSDKFCDYIQAMVDSDSATGKIIILDTLKKFTEIMDKRTGTAFGKTVREFVSKGGSNIMLAHTNKHRDSENKVVYAGTSDIVDDADCAYSLDVVDVDQGLDCKTVMFENFKSRGDVEQEACYSYSTAEGHSYRSLLESVRAIDGKESGEVKRQAAVNLILEKNSDIIEAITEVIQAGTVTKTELVKEVAERSFVSRGRVQAVLKRHTGGYWSSGHRWNFKPGEKNAKEFFMIPDPDFFDLT